MIYSSTSLASRGLSVSVRVMGDDMLEALTRGGALTSSDEERIDAVLGRVRVAMHAHMHRVACFKAVAKSGVASLLSGLLALLTIELLKIALVYSEDEYWARWARSAQESEDSVDNISTRVMLVVIPVIATSAAIFVKVLAKLAEVGDEVHRVYDRLRDIRVARASAVLLGGGGEIATLLSDTTCMQSWDILRIPVDSRFVANAVLSLGTGCIFALAPMWLK